MKSICFITASPATLHAFMRNHLLALMGQYNITAVANFDASHFAGDWMPGVRLVSLPIERRIDLVADLRALIGLFLLFRREGFDAVHSITPKAGLLAMMAARLAGVPHRIHWFTGQVWVTHKGFARNLLKTADRIVAMCANHLLADSFSQLDFLETETVVAKRLASVIGYGSISGVDLGHFHPDATLRNKMRKEWGLPQKACLLLFAGRLNQDKGILDLALAFAELSRRRNDVWLVVVGHDEAGIVNEFERLCGVALSRVRRFDYLATLMHAMVAADILVLPSYREGFGTVVIEAAACGVPAVVSRIYGLTDAVDENVTGLMHLAGDVPGLVDCLQRLCDDGDLRQKMGAAACARAQAQFSMVEVTAGLVAYYEDIFKSDYRHHQKSFL